MSPKSLLRHPRVVCRFDELTSGRFRRVLRDTVPEPKAVRRVIACSGKVYYELRDAVDSGERDDLAIVRVEQLYPLREKDLRNAFAPYENAEVCWVQEEPANMGAWRNLQLRFPGIFSKSICRPASASPATGSPGSHKHEQRRLIERAISA